mmetsp:Transcript_10315/g.30583  ORF Transcript_10315/g.30583 Transcript_10315/m.30583 type:complete len:259 (-) Transcript_10315:496-1272(-)
MGKRLPGGKRRGPLPACMREWDKPQPFFPQMESVTEVTDGAPTQFDNRVNYHQTASWRARNNIRRMAIKLITMHGKSVCDGVSNSPNKALADAGARGELIDPGARPAALYLAQHKPTPSKAKIDGGGYWQADHVLYGYYETTLFTVSEIPEAKPAPGSNQIHMSVGMSDDNDTAQRDGTLTWRNVFCPCEPCCRLDFTHCKMTKEFGKVKIMKFPRVTQTGPTQTESLEEFGAYLDRDTIVALRCDAGRPSRVASGLR